ncbi:hypothetical protein [Lactococcus taiwanensis]|uniref:hypothetical protein n=1 Tax=Lactococcus taiwanensis TaxID=1151742 RepID=UPI0019637D0E|nr:hypothetical protein [Lactococcus taiwanensis]QRZ11829.1 hypothetical protein JVB21_04065 [Lactococcus taiwanensis]
MIETRLSDLDYCYASVELLKVLENNAYLRNERIRTFLEQRASRETRIVSLVALLFPTVLLILLFGFPGNFARELISIENFLFRMFSLLMLGLFIFIFCFLLMHQLWHLHLVKPLRKKLTHDLKKELLDDIKKIDEHTESIVQKSLFTQPRVPELYLCTEILPLLIRYFEKGLADFMKEAVYALELELKHTGQYHHLVPRVTFLQRERDYLQNRMAYLNKLLK